MQTWSANVQLEIYEGGASVYITESFEGPAGCTVHPESRCADMRCNGRKNHDMSRPLPSHMRQ